MSIKSNLIFHYDYLLFKGNWVGVRLDDSIDEREIKNILPCNYIFQKLKISDFKFYFIFREFNIPQFFVFSRKNLRNFIEKEKESFDAVIKGDYIIKDSNVVLKNFNRIILPKQVYFDRFNNDYNFTTQYVYKNKNGDFEFYTYHGVPTGKLIVFPIYRVLFFPLGFSTILVKEEDLVLSVGR